MNRSTLTHALPAACASSAAACSGDYALGDLSDRDQPLAEAADQTAAEHADTSLAAALPEPDVTFGIETMSTRGGVASTDMDGDGLDDFAIAETDPDTYTSYVNVRYGGPRPEHNQEFGVRAGDFILGESGARLMIDDIDTPIEGVLAAGDVDGDGFGDLLVTMLRCQPSQDNEGVYLVYGGPERLTDLTFLEEVGVRLVPSRVLTEPRDGVACADGGQHVAGVGDLDGDGFDDLVLAEPPVRDNSEFPPTVVGDSVASAYVFYGGPVRLEDDTPWDAADATLRSDLELELTPSGDIDGDGLADLFLGAGTFFNDLGMPSGLLLVRGARERLSGTRDLDAVGQRLEDAFAGFTAPARFTGDLDGDGVNDVFIRDSGGQQHLFYGRPGLFLDGVDFAAAEASIPLHATPLDVLSVGDLDGDGDGELVARFGLLDAETPYAADVAALSGTSGRSRGDLIFPIEEVQAARPLGLYNVFSQAPDAVIPAGDLDGDGADDLFTVSLYYEREEDFFTATTPQLNIHYGTPGGTDAPLRETLR